MEPCLIEFPVVPLAYSIFEFGGMCGESIDYLPTNEDAVLFGIDDLLPFLYVDIFEDDYPLRSWTCCWSLELTFGSMPL